MVRRVLLWASILALVSSGALVGSGLASSQLTASTYSTHNCNYGTGGPLANDICWFNYGSNYSVSAGNTQPFRENLPNGDYVKFDLTYSPEDNSSPTVNAVISPTFSYAAFGNAGYKNVKGYPILYGGGDSAKWEFTLSNIGVYYPSGIPVPTYEIVAADGETTNNGESVVFKTDGASWQPVGDMLHEYDPSSGTNDSVRTDSTLRFDNTCGGNSGYTSTESGSALYANLGIGTSKVTCEGSNSKGVGALVVSSANPRKISATDLTTAAEQGVVFGVETPAAQQVVTPTPPAPVARLSLTKTESPSSPNPITKAGQSVTYDFRVTNTGNTLLNDLVVSDTQSVPGEALNGPVSCPTTSVAAGASVTCTGSYTVTSTDIANAEVTDTAVAKATTPTGINVTSNTSAYTIVVSTPTTTTKTVTPT
ncbi:CshA/CshB family fibrillar adhesin-related protein, partial [Ferrimicrobium acidiphilum]